MAVGTRSGLFFDHGGGTLSESVIQVDTNGDPVSVASSSLAASESHIGEIGVNTALITITPTITAGAYSAGDIIGVTQTLTNAMRITSGSGLLKSITIMDSGNQKAALDLLFFDAATTNVQADNAAYAWQSADFAKLIAYVSVPTASYVTIASEAVVTVQCEIPVQASGSTNLYMIITTTGTPTYTATNDLKFRIGFIRS